jgi:hypothetical protein
MIIKLSKEEVEFLKNFSSVVYYDENSWYYLPFWFKEVSEEQFEIFSFEEVPKRVKEIAKNENSNL